MSAENITSDINVLTTAVTMLRTAEEKIDDIVRDVNGELDRMQGRVSENAALNALQQTSRIVPPNLTERINILLLNIGDLVVERENA